MENSLLRDLESKENIKYQINIMLYRHAEKAGLSGNLTKKGKEDANDYFSNEYEKIILDSKSEGVDVEYSPIYRTEETSNIYKAVLRRDGIGKIKSQKVDDRLSEGTIAEHKDILEAYGGLGGKWIKPWIDAKERPLPSVKTGKEVVADFSSWLLEKLKNAKERGGYQEIDAFSHAPLMLAFLLKVEEKIGEKILPEKWENGTDPKKSIFSEGALGYLSNIHIWSGSDSSSKINLSFSGKKIEFPVSVLEELSKK